MNFRSYSRAKAIESIENLIKYYDNKENDEESFEVDVIDAICSNGDLHLLMFINENPELFNLEWDINNMDCAAETGKLDVVKWLHYNRTEGCTTNAADSAAELGHFDVVEWLIENRKEGCTERTIYRAASEGKFDIMKYIISKTKMDISYEKIIVYLNTHNCSEKAKELELWLLEQNSN